MLACRRVLWELQCLVNRKYFITILHTSDFFTIYWITIYWILVINCYLFIGLYTGYFVWNFFTSITMPSVDASMCSCNDCRKKKSTVKLCQGDLMLCLECNEIRFPSSSKPAVTIKNTTMPVVPPATEANKVITTPSRLASLLSASPLRPSVFKTTKATAPATCIGVCTFGPGDSGKTQECSFCGNTFHYTCVGITRKQTVWFCRSCKGMPVQLRELSAKVDRHEMTIERQTLLNTALAKKSQALQEQVTCMKSDLSPLTRTLKDDKSKPKPSPQAAAPETSTPKGSTPTDAIKKSTTTESETNESTTTKTKPASNSLLIGDSIIKQINQRGLSNCEVKCLRGAQVSGVHEALRDVDVVIYDTIMIHVGTNDCTSDVNVTKASKDYTKLVDSLQSRSPNTAIVLSTVCPRSDGEHTSRVDALNRHIRDIVARKGCIVVDNDNNFKLNDKTTDTSTLDNRGLHLSKRGTKRLLMNLNNVHKIMEITTKENSESNNHESYRQRQLPSKPAARSPRNTRHAHSFQPRSFQPRSFQSRGPQSQRSRRRPETTRRHESQHHQEYTGCHFCGSLSHSRRNCRYEEPVECYECGHLGHLSYFCNHESR